VLVDAAWLAGWSEDGVAVVEAEAEGVAAVEVWLLA
jgi:hypothetical protein